MDNHRTRLEVGQRAPEFAVIDSTGAPFSFGFPRDSAVLLTFCRYASCPLCNLRVHELEARFASWKQRGLDIVVVFQSPPERFADYVGRQQVSFSMLSDDEEQTYALYGLESSWVGFLSPTNVPPLAVAATKGFLVGAQDGTVNRLPAEFLIGADGVIERCYYGKTIGDHMPFEEIEAWLDAQT